jgi:hypothetical protein
MADEQRERLECFRAFIKAAEEGEPIPPVAEDDLRRLHEVSADMAKRRVGKDGMVSVDLMARVCSPGANLPAVWLRHTQLRLLIRQGVLAKWQRNADWDDAVYRVAAIIPMNGLQLDQEAFAQHLHYKAAA